MTASMLLVLLVFGIVGAVVCLKRALRPHPLVIPGTWQAPPPRQPADGTAAEVVPAVPSPPPTEWTFSLRANGREVFTPEPLAPGRVYRLTFSGTYDYSAGFLDRRRADGIFRTDAHGNFTIRYRGLEVDGGPAGSRKLESWAEDRPSNRYSGLVDGAGRRIPLRLVPPDNNYSAGSLEVKLELLSEGTPSVAAQRQQRAAERAVHRAEQAAQKRAEQEQKEQAQQALALRQQQEQERRAELRRQAEVQHQRQQLQQQVDELKRMVHINAHVFDEKFRQAYVFKHQQEIRGELGRAWAADYDAVMANRELVRTLKEQAPEVLAWHEARLEMYREAEVLDVLPEALGRPPKPVPLTIRAEQSIRENLADLYRVRETRDHAERTAQVPPSGQVLSRYDAGVQAGLRQLTRYGIVADSPERAEQQFQELAAQRPFQSIYEQIRDKIVAGDSSALDVLAERLKDLFMHDCIVVKQRRDAIRRKHWHEQYDADARLAASRAEIAQLLDCLRRRGLQIDLHQVEREVSREDGVVGLMQEKLRLKEFLRSIAMDEQAEQLDAIYEDLLREVLDPKPRDENYA